ncbi:hypothetical protein ACFROC_10005 [Nocardia tengchongensis]|uniref:hypothetical protein n=1 Tax=Nocardia tengchongensis TaxID=2055889 RepID=UPI003689AED3
MGMEDEARRHLDARQDAEMQKADRQARTAAEFGHLISKHLPEVLMALKKNRCKPEHRALWTKGWTADIQYSPANDKSGGASQRIRFWSDGTWEYLPQLHNLPIFWAEVPPSEELIHGSFVRFLTWKLPTRE